MSLEILWYAVIGFSIIFYIVLDGFDLGVGMLHLFARKDEERRLFLNAIGPVWDGNEVWLVVVGGALFAGFPNVYATLFSSFYTLSMILLCGLIFRVVAIEFRSKQPGRLWRSLWDTVFCCASFVIAIGVGLVLGNLIEGIPLDVHQNFVGQFSDFFRPYSLLISAMSVSIFTMHGSIYLVMKTEGKIQERLRRWVKRSIAVFVITYLAVTIATLVYMPYMTAQMRAMPILFLVALGALLAILNVVREIYKKHDGRAFLSSALGIALLFIVFGIGTFPTMIRSSISSEEHSLTLFNSASSPLTLKVLLIIVAIGIPLVLAYGFYIYRIFRGKVKIGPASY